MQFEKVRKNHKKEIIIGGLITIGIISVIFMTTTRARYKTTEKLEHVIAGTINYKIPDLQIVALYTETDDGYTEIEDIPTSGYQLNTKKSVCNIYNGRTYIENAPVDNKVTINYHDGVIGIDNISKKNTRCYLYFDKNKISASETVLAKVTINENTPDFNQIADSNEGVFKAEDGMYGGTSYYWRGAVTNNYVKFAGFCWRIIRINGDKSIRLIYDGTTCHANGEITTDSIAILNQNYSNENRHSEYVGWTYIEGQQRPFNDDTAIESNIKIQSDTWFSNNIIETNADKVADGKFCNDRNIGSGTWTSEEKNEFYYAARTRLDNKKPTLACNEDDVYILKIGAITADEVMYAGGKRNGTINQQYYLYNGQNYWTMSPDFFNSNRFRFIFNFNDSGALSDTYLESNIRPIINLKSNVTFSDGDGTQNNPYIVAD